MKKIVKLIEDVLQLNIKKVTKQQLVDLICEFGVVYEPREPYGEWNKFMVKDLGIYQTPGQLASALKELLKHEIKSYCELGVYHGGNFLFVSTILAAKYPEIESIGIDLDCRFLHPELKKILNVKSGTSRDFKGQKFDLVHIDADHQYENVKEDWENLGQHAKICMFHDINDDTCPGPKQFWNEIKEGKNFKEFLYQSEGKNIHGIGIIFNE